MEKHFCKLNFKKHSIQYPEIQTSWDFVRIFILNFLNLFKKILPGSEVVARLRDRFFIEGRHSIPCHTPLIQLSSLFWNSSWSSALEHLLHDQAVQIPFSGGLFSFSSNYVSSVKCISYGNLRRWLMRWKCFFNGLLAFAALCAEQYFIKIVSSQPRCF